MKKLLLLLFLIPNLVMAESWVCKSVFETFLTFKRIDNVFVEDRDAKIYDIFSESDSSIRLIGSDKKWLGIWTVILEKKPTPRFSEAALYPELEPMRNIGGYCKVVE